MSAFQPYAGAYEQGGEVYRWRCYATARVHEVRTSRFTELPRPPAGAQWLMRSRREGEPLVAWLVDEGVQDFSHMLLQLDVQDRVQERVHDRVAEEPRVFARAV